MDLSAGWANFLRSRLRRSLGLGAWPLAGAGGGGGGAGVSGLAASPLAADRGWRLGWTRSRSRRALAASPLAGGCGRELGAHSGARHRARNAVCFTAGGDL